MKNISFYYCCFSFHFFKAFLQNVIIIGCWQRQANCYKKKRPLLKDVILVKHQAKTSFLSSPDVANRNSFKTALVVADQNIWGTKQFSQILCDNCPNHDFASLHGDAQIRHNFT